MGGSRPSLLIESTDSMIINYFACKSRHNLIAIPDSLYYGVSLSLYGPGSQVILISVLGVHESSTERTSQLLPH